MTDVDTSTFYTVTAPLGRVLDYLGRTIRPILVGRGTPEVVAASLLLWCIITYPEVAMAPSHETTFGALDEIHGRGMIKPSNICSVPIRINRNAE